MTRPAAFSALRRRAGDFVVDL